MPVVSPVSERMTVVCLLLLTFATGIVDAISVLVLGHVFVANMTGNVIFLGFWFAPHTVVDMPAALVAFVSFVMGAVVGGRLARHLDDDVRRWVTVALGIEVVVSRKLAVPAEKVSSVVEEALTARRPRPRYIVGVGPKLQVGLMTNLPASVRDRVLRRVSGQP
jgi:uncharacterized membrane protein YoaK (UPF0700 family)